MENLQPLISVILPVYNCEIFLEKCLESIFCQTYSNIEVIAVDDCSTDNSFSILLKWKNKNLKIFKNSKNEGNSYSLNRAINLSKGDYIMRMDGDDYIDKNKIEKQLLFLLNNPNVDVVGCNYIRVNYHGKIMHTSKLPSSDKEIKKLLTVKKFLLSGPNFSITDGTIMAKADWFHNHKYDNAIFYSQDFDLIARSLGNSTFHNLEESLYFYRQGSGVTANFRAQVISCLVRYNAIRCINNLSFKQRLICYISLTFRPLIYMAVLFYYKLTEIKKNDLCI